MFKKTTLIAAAFGLALVGFNADAATVLQSQYGILDLNANGGINPNTGNPWQAGDQYRLAFYSQGTRDASTTDPAVYNAWVTAQAQLNPALNGSTWTAIISTVTVNVKDNTGTADQSGGAGVGGAGLPVYAMDGTTAIARNNADIWNGWSNPFDGNTTVRLTSGTTNQNSNGDDVVASQSVHYSPFLDQFALGDSANVHGVNVWSGFNNNGGVTHLTQAAGSTPANQDGSTGTTQWGSSNANNAGRVVRRGNSNNVTTNLHLFALSDPLTVTAVPEPATGVMALVGLGAIAMRRRRG